MELFSQPERAGAAAKAPAPLADRMRPRQLDEIVGQEHLLGAGRVLRTAIETGELHSMILWGPPGSGKTTLASLMAHVTGARFVAFSAVLSGVKEIREVIAEAERERGRHGARTILFVDEIHRFNRAQQDAFLPHVEKGTVVPAGGRRYLTEASIREAAQRRTLLYDKSGEEHYNLISALHKSLRDSDPDAALYWLTRMLEAGEDRLYVARRLVRFASEDVGNADPGALTLTLAAKEAYDFLGDPEGELALAQATLYLALAPKSNAVYLAYNEAKDDVQQRPAEPVPLHIRNAPTRLMKDLGYGAGYQYAHDAPEARVDQDDLPEALHGRQYYRPTDRGLEAELGRRLAEWKRWRSEQRRPRV